MNNFKVENLFPTPILIKKIEREFTKTEIDYFLNQKHEAVPNTGNFTTIDNYVLNRPELLSLKTFLNGSCNDYLQHVISPKNKIDLRITQSWLNFTHLGEYHHSHKHPNSIISGVLYIRADKTNDQIQFINSTDYEQIKPEVEHWNKWNSETWGFPVETGELFLFPSWIRHGVVRKQDSQTRISLSFNTFYRGKIGQNDKLNELDL